MTPPSHSHNALGGHFKNKSTKGQVLFLSRGRYFGGLIVYRYLEGCQEQ